MRSDSGEMPVFWGCGVTAQVVVMESLAGIEGVKVIGHAPGHMVCCDAPADFNLAADSFMLAPSVDSTTRRELE
jgi:D-glutamate cyclase